MSLSTSRAVDPCGRYSGAGRKELRRFPALCTIPLLLAVALVVPVRVRAEETATGFDCAVVLAEPADDFLNACPATIAEVIIANGNVFDTSLAEEDSGLFRAANALHIQTNQEVIRRQLLFAAGDPYSRPLLNESERILRRARYLYDADIRPVNYRNGLVDVVVVTRDVWTLTPDIGFGRGGGVNRTHFELEESNFLGLGKDVTVSRSSNVDRSTSMLRYRDPSVAGSHAQAEAWYAKYSDGRLIRLSLARPFFSLDTRWAASATVNEDERVESVYSDGHIRSRFAHQSRFFEAYVGLSSGLEEGKATRWSLGYTYDRDLFSVVDELGTARGEAPADRLLSYPWVGLELVSDNFMEAHDLDRIARVEDVSLGPSLRARLGYTSRAFGADRDQLILRLNAERGWRPSEKTLFLVDAYGEGRFWGGTTENLRLATSARFYLRNFGQHLFFARLELAAADNPDPEAQILLGGDNGLRGYPLRYRDGDRSFLFTVEQRFYTPWHLAQLAHLGAAVFADVGSAWYATGDNRQRFLRDVGFGLRLAPSRSSRAPMIHVDIAFPLDGGGIDRVQWLISTHDTF